jgi:uncharacterized protein (TIGR00369 family)
MTTTEDRSRIVTWDDPVASWKAASGLGGIEVLRAIEGGDLPAPPVARLLGMEVEQVSEGLVTFAFEPAEYHYNPLGTVHGGYAATLLDSAMGCSVHSTLAPGDTYTTLELKINYLRALTHETGEVRGIGTVINEGRTTVLAEGRVEDAAGKLYAFATTTCIVKRSSQ